MTTPTLRDVGQLAGVSIKTVSRVVNGDPEVAEATAEKVREAIGVLGYRPNPLARSLRTGRDEAVGLVVETISDPFFAAVTEAVEEAAREAGLFLIIASAGATVDEERAVVLGLLHRSVSGLIVVPCRLDYGHERLPIGPGGVPVVFIDRAPEGFSADTVVVDNEDSARRATAHLVAHGHRRIAFVGTSLDRVPLRHRLDGYKRALRDAGIAYDAALVVSHSRGVDATGPILAGVLTMAEPATAVLSANAVAAVDVVRELHGTGRTDVAFVSFDDFPIADSLTPPVTVHRQDPTLMGRTATELLLRRLRGEDGPARHVVLPTTFLERGSGEIGPPSSPDPC
ncbi:MAG TPA: LacI family DNA-binding transcriptional regulator [Acidimicrobiales bacterium]|nr:LacI family DNA-binding transcriptional regulator [Acidimicrobiales bacterium]